MDHISRNVVQIRGKIFMFYTAIRIQQETNSTTSIREDPCHPWLKIPHPPRHFYRGIHFTIGTRADFRYNIHRSVQGLHQNGDGRGGKGLCVCGVDWKSRKFFKVFLAKMSISFV
jgi:hypothetical protein